MATRHNKKRNTGFVFEALVREATKAILAEDNNKKQVVVSTIKEFFKKGTELSKELECYQALSKDNNLPPQLGEKLIFEVKRKAAALNKRKLTEEKNALISEINKNISKDVFSNFVPNYRALATIAQIFKSDTPVKERVLLEANIIQNITEDTEEQSTPMEHIDSLVVKNFIEKFNTAYTGLLSEQRQLLSKYVTSINDGYTEFQFFINEELERIKDVVTNSLSDKVVKDDNFMLEGINNVLEKIEEMRNITIDEKFLMKMLKLQKLSSEIQNDD
tara:strand:+ start:1293 stop:2117 length:825 start_codon:yes stop_codon:yes gene_type:complete